MLRLTNSLLTGVSSAIMVFFAIPKLLGKEQSKAGFAEFEKALAIDAEFFRVFTGIAELGIAALLTACLVNKKHISWIIGVWLFASHDDHSIRFRVLSSRRA